MAYKKTIPKQQNYSSIANAKKDHLSAQQAAEVKANETRRKKKLKFEDVQNMDSKDIEKFKPEDLVDVDSHDSDHEILA